MVHTQVAAVLLIAANLESRLDLLTISIQMLSTDGPTEVYPAASDMVPTYDILSV